MKNLITNIFVLLVSVWCGVAFLRSLVKKATTQTRDKHLKIYTSAKSERRGFDSLSPHHIYKQSANNQLKWTFYTPFVLCIALRSILHNTNGS